MSMVDGTQQRVHRRDANELDLLTRPEHLFRYYMRLMFFFHLAVRSEEKERKRCKINKKEKMYKGKREREAKNEGLTKCYIFEIKY